MKDEGEKRFFILSSAYFSTPFFLMFSIAVFRFSIASGESAMQLVSLNIRASKRSGKFNMALNEMYPPMDNPHNTVLSIFRISIKLIRSLTKSSIENSTFPEPESPCPRTSYVIT